MRIAVDPHPLYPAFLTFALEHPQLFPGEDIVRARIDMSLSDEIRGLWQSGSPTDEERLSPDEFPPFAAECHAWFPWSVGLSADPGKSPNRTFPSPNSKQAENPVETRGDGRGVFFHRSCLSPRCIDYGSQPLLSHVTIEFLVTATLCRSRSLRPQIHLPPSTSAHRPAVA